MTPLCPVCRNALNNTTGSIWFCQPRKIKFTRCNTVLEMSHATLYFDGDKCIYQVLIAGGYTFKIWDDDKRQKTEIEYLKKTEKKYHSRVKEFSWHKLIDIPAVVSMPWHNSPKVAEKVKTYIIFS